MCKGAPDLSLFAANEASAPPRALTPRSGMVCSMAATMTCLGSTRGPEDGDVPGMPKQGVRVHLLAPFC